MIQKVTYGEKTAKFQIRTNEEHVQKHWLAGNFYETQRNGVLNWAAANAELFKGKPAIDVGAAIGNHTIFFLKVCGCSKITCIEPFEMNRDHLAENIRLNKVVKKTKIIEGAAWSSATNGDFVPSDAPVGVGGQLMGKTRQNEDGETAFYTLDDIGPKGTGLIKIDVEGSEVEVLKGALKLIERDRPVIIVEATGGPRDNYKIVANMLKQLKYKPVSHKEKSGQWVATKFNHGTTYVFLP